MHSTNQQKDGQNKVLPFEEAYKDRQAEERLLEEIIGKEAVDHLRGKKSGAESANVIPL